MTGSAYDPAHLQLLSELISTHAVSYPVTTLSLDSMGVRLPERATAMLRRLADSGATREIAATFLQELARELAAAPGIPRISCVASGPRPVGSVRDTAAVMELLFSHSTRQILVVGYALHQGTDVLRTLATRMDLFEGLDVTMCLDVARQYGDTSLSADIVARWVQRFKNEQWPGKRLPKLFHDPRALSPIADNRRALHAKCIVSDQRYTFITSANLTHAAQEKNIELGVLVENEEFAKLVSSHFQSLMSEHVFRQIPF